MVCVYSEKSFSLKANNEWEMTSSVPMDAFFVCMINFDGFYLPSLFTFRKPTYFVTYLKKVKVVLPLRLSRCCLLRIGILLSTVSLTSAGKSPVLRIGSVNIPTSNWNAQFNMVTGPRVGTYQFTFMSSPTLPENNHGRWTYMYIYVCTLYFENKINPDKRVYSRHHQGINWEVCQSLNRLSFILWVYW